MPDNLLRTFAPELEVRKASDGGDGRTVVGIAVPYNRRQRITHDLVEQFAPGSFNHQLRAPNRVKFGREHPFLGGAIIGRAVELRNDAAGLWGAWRVSATQAGDEALELAKDGVLDELSVGFRERQNRRESDGTITRVTADLIEVSLVLQGAYGRHATVEAVRASQGAAVCTCGAPLEEADDQRPNAARAAQVLANLRVLPSVV